MSAQRNIRPAMQPKNILVRVGVWVAFAIPYYTLMSLAIAGSATTTPGVENIFLGKIYKTGTDPNGFGSLRFGYLGFCAYVGDTSTDGNTYRNTLGFQCIGRPYAQSLSQMNATLHVSEQFIQLGADLQADMSVYMPVVALILFIFGFFADTAAWILAGIGRPVGGAGAIAMPLLWAAVATTFGAAQTITIAMNSVTSVVESSGLGCSQNVNIEQGTALKAIQWSAFAFAILFTLAIHVITSDNLYGFGISPRLGRGRGRGRAPSMSSASYDDASLDSRDSRI